MGKEYEGINRSTFLVANDGLIQAVIQKVKTKDHANQILELLES
jgi:peroxiredoxin Q/BCP